jgi:hypothetical protein
LPNAACKGAGAGSPASPPISRGAQKNNTKSQRFQVFYARVYFVTRHGYESSQAGFTTVRVFAILLMGEKKKSNND